MVALFGILAFGLLISGCSVATPLCDQAGTLLTQGRLADAMALYARAGEQDEGNCAGNGLRAAGDRIGQAAAEEARGAAAELAGDTAGAIAAYQAALELNNGDVRAVAGLGRLGQQVGTPAPAEIPALPPRVEQPNWWGTGWPLVIGAVLLAAALAAVGYALFRQDALRRRMAGLETLAANPIAQPVADQSAVARLQERTDAAADVLAERCAALEDGLARLESSGARQNRLLELLAGQLAGPQAGGVQREQLFGAPPPQADVAGEGSGVVDVELVGVVMADGSRRTVVQRRRWTPPDEAATAALVAQVGPDPVVVADVLATSSVTPAWAHGSELWLLPPATGFDAEESDGPLATLVAGGAMRTGELVELTPDMAGMFDTDAPVTFLSRLVTVVMQGTWRYASLTSEAHDAASGIAATALEAAAALTGPAWAGTTGRTPGSPVELDRLLGRPVADAEDRPAAPVVVRVVADTLDESPGGLHTAWRIVGIEVDVDAVLPAFNRTAADAARALADNPTDRAAIEAFRNALRPAPSAASGADPGHPPTTAVPMGVTTIGCDVLATGDQRVGFTYRVATSRLDLARMLKESAHLTRAFAEQLGAVRSGTPTRAFDDAVREVVGPEQLGPVVATVPGRAPRLTVGPETAGAVETRYAPVGADPADAPEARPDPEQTRNGARMYDHLRRHSRPTEPVVLPEAPPPRG